jgi:Leucine-rich repeat (LRR) protein
MTEGVIASAKSHELTQARYKVGKHELARNDYEVVLYWSRELSIDPERIMDILETTVATGEFVDEDDIILRIEHGRFASLVWDFNQLPITAVTWCDSLLLEELTCKGKCSITDRVLKPKIHSLQQFDAINIGLKAIDLQGVPNLRKMDCSFNQLISELDLSSVPELTRLRCSHNQLTELDLSPVPELKELSCGRNHLTDLDLSPVPELTRLWCYGNQLTELDLSPVPKLTLLSSGFSQLTELDLSPVPELKELRCSNSQLTDLDLSPVPGLKELGCSDNQLTELDLSPVPELKELSCGRNHLTDLDLSPVPKLTDLTCSENPISKIYISLRTNRDVLKVVSPEVLIITREVDEA